MDETREEQTGEPQVVHESGDAKAPSPPMPPLIIACTPVIFLVAALCAGTIALKQSAHIPLILATVVAGALAWSYGHSWRDIVDGITKGVAQAIPACLILMVIGALIGTWMLSGVVPTLVVYGLQVISPGFFLVTACLVCAVVSLATGSSWSTAGTVGVALIGIGAALGIPLGMCAGAVISGAYFGDKLSPLSDTTNLAPAVAGTDLFTHIRHMLYTTVPSLMIACTLYYFIGMRFSATASAGSVSAILAAVKGGFVIHWALLLVPVAVVALVALRLPALPALLAGTFLGGVVAWLVQGKGMAVILQSAQAGFVSKTGNATVDGLLSRGGIQNMLSTVALIIFALAFGGAMERGGMLRSLAAGILRGAKNTGSLILRTVLTCIGMNILAADQYMAVIIPGRMYKDAYADLGLDPRNLSRALEDSGTLTSPLVPWNTCGAFMTATLKVAPQAYLWYAFLNLLNPVISVVYGYTGFTMTKIDEREGASTEEPSAA